MPNFAPVIEFVMQQIALAERSGKPLRPPPILLMGESGIGKTHFTYEMAKVLETTVHRQPFDNAQSNSPLRGSERYWSNSSTGALWDLIVLGEVANPVVLLDEIDKGARGLDSSQPINALLTLLEPLTSSCVKDVSVDFEFDASHAWYVATGNEIKNIAAPVRSRFVEFTIEPTDIDGRLLLAKSMVETTLDRLLTPEDRTRFKPLSNMQMCSLAWRSAREIRKAMERALGAAALADRWHIEDADLELGKASSRPIEAKQVPRGDDGDGDMAVFVRLRP